MGHFKRVLLNVVDHEFVILEVIHLLIDEWDEVYLRLLVKLLAEGQFQFPIWLLLVVILVLDSVLVVS